MTPVVFTKTNSSGVYLFINVPRGKYKVKSNELEIIDTEVGLPLEKAPNMSKFTLGQEFVTTILTKNLTEGILENGATIGNSNYVGNIGGSSDGSVKVNIESPTSAEYTIEAEYISTAIGNLNLEVNGVSTHIVLAKGGSDVNNPGIFTSRISLNKGTNVIKIKGHNNRYAPDFRNITLKLSPFIGLVELETSMLSGDAEITYVSGVKFASKIGLKKENTLTVPIDIPLGGEYTIKFYHLNDEDAPLEIDINGFGLGPYNMPATDDLDLQDARMFEFKVLLDKGINKIIFHNKWSNEPTPLIGHIVYTQTQYLKEIPAISTTLGGSSIISNNFVIDIGGNGNGYVEFTENVPYTGIYDLIINYATIEEYRKAYILINGVDTDKIYSFEKTDSLGIIDVKSLLVKLNLNSGENRIRIK